MPGITQVGAQYRFTDDRFIDEAAERTGLVFNKATHTVTDLVFRAGTESTARITVGRKDGEPGPTGGGVTTQEAEFEVQDDFWLTEINSDFPSAPWNLASVTVTSATLNAGAEATIDVTVGPKP